MGWERPQAHFTPSDSMNLTEAIRVSAAIPLGQQITFSPDASGVVIGVGAVIACLPSSAGSTAISRKRFQPRRRRFYHQQTFPVITNIDQLIEGEKRKDITLEDYYAVAEAATGAPTSARW